MLLIWYFEDNTICILSFSVSSIEHFGSNKQITKSLNEVFRILKPGGCFVLTTELSLNKLGRNIPNTKVFSLEELKRVIRDSDFKESGHKFDIEIEDRFLSDMIKLPQEVYKRPHVILRFLRTIFTSLSVVLIKPGEIAGKGDWNTGYQYKDFTYGNSLKIKTSKTALEYGEKLNLEIIIKNLSNFDWYTGGKSYRIALGIKLLDYSGNITDSVFGEITIPENIMKGKSLKFEHQLKLGLSPGKYKLFFDLKREYITWFSEKGTKPVVIDIEITK